MILVTTFAFVQTLVVLYLLPLRRAQARDYSYIKALLTLLILHLGIKLYILGVLHDPALFRRLNSFTTFGYGPLVYFQYRQLLGKPLHRSTQVLHLIPFFIAFGLYLFCVVTQLPLEEPALFSAIFKPYGYLGVVSLAFYHGFMLWIMQRKPLTSRADQRLLRQISGLFIAAFAAGQVSRLMTNWLHVEWEGHAMPYLIFALIPFVCLRFFFTQSAEKEPEVATTPVVEPVEEENRQAVAYKKSGLAEAQLEERWRALETIMQREKPYRNPELSLDDLAGKLAISRQHMSQILSVKAEKNFYVYINEYRVREMIRLLQQKPRGRMGELMIQVGFQSKTTFNTYFKTVTGLSPTQYQRLLLSEFKTSASEFKDKVKLV